jgi:hypothetical protein
MKNLHLFNINEIEEFLKANQTFEFSFDSKEEKYEFIDRALREVKYFKLSRKDKRIVIKYLKLLTGYGKSQLHALFKKAGNGRLQLEAYKRHKFPKKYTDYDISLLAETDEAHQRLNGGATRTILKREYEVFGKKEYENLAKISVAHIYNLRNTNLYRVEYKGLNYTKTNPSKVSIGERAKPNPEGKPGHVRVDSVHQGDFEREKGVYHINLIDEITQWEILGAIEKISYQYLLPLLEGMIEAFPFKIVEFHADNGSEYINHQVADMLNRLLIKLTKSRPRRSNDNALVETKNGSIIRKHMGFVHIPASNATLINEFYQKYFNPYINYHRPCGFATTTITTRHGKVQKKYDQYMTPYQKLKSLDNAKDYLKPETTFDELDIIAYSLSDNEAAKLMQGKKDKLFNEIFKERKEIV